MKKLKKKNKPNKPYFRIINKILFLLFIFLLSTQLGKHFFPSFSYLNGVRVDYLSPTLYLTDILVVLLFFLNFNTVVDFFKNKKVLIGLSLLFINAVLAKNQPVALYQLIRIVEFLIIFSLSSILFKVIKEKTILVVLLLTSSFQFLLVVLQLVYRQSIQGVFYWFGERLFNLSTPGIAKASLKGIEFLRPYGTFSHPNSLAGFFLLLYFYVLVDRKFEKYFLLKSLCLFIFSVLILLSFSKVAILTYLILNTFYFMRNTKVTCRICWLSRIIIPIIISFLFLQAVTDPLTLEKRIGLFKNSLEIISQHPVLGVGIGNYLIAQSVFASKYFLFFNQPVHNIFLLFIAETGILGGAVIISFLFKPVYRIIKNNPYIIFVVFLTGFFDHYWLTLMQNWLVLALVYGSVSSSFFISRFNLRS
ncbi:hypothetical protein HZA76_02290 [Candidatus Roizmanbacteria bacterium]|nr:hypothetical protein [Candidatus Roizmanbacteria bacterium]